MEIAVTSVMNNSSVISVPEGCVTIQIFPYIPWDNEDNLVPKEVDTIIKLVSSGLFLPFVFITSSVTNIINMVVFYKHGLKERINACLFILALMDLLSITVAYVYTSDAVVMFFMGKGNELGIMGHFFNRNYLMGLFGLLLASQMVYCVIALERCLCITHPMLVKSFMSTRLTVLVLCAMVLVMIGSCIIVIGLRYGILCLFDPIDRSITYLNYPTEFYFRHQFVMDFMYSIVYGLFFPGLVLITVSVCTVVTAVQLKKISQWRESVSSASGSVTSRDVAITRMIFGTSVLFIVCLVPTVVMRCSFLIVPDLTMGGRYDNLAWVIRRIYQIATAINNTFNFFIYYAYGSKFRETTNRLFFRCYCTKNTDGRTAKSTNVKKGSHSANLRIQSISMQVK